MSEIVQTPSYLIDLFSTNPALASIICIVLALVGVSWVLRSVPDGKGLNVCTEKFRLFRRIRFFIIVFVLMFFVNYMSIEIKVNNVPQFLQISTFACSPILFICLSYGFPRIAGYGSYDKDNWNFWFGHKIMLGVFSVVYAFTSVIFFLIFTPRGDLRIPYAGIISFVQAITYYRCWNMFQNRSAALKFYENERWIYIYTICDDYRTAICGYSPVTRDADVIISKDISGMEMQQTYIEQFQQCFNSFRFVISNLLNNKVIKLKNPTYCVLKSVKIRIRYWEGKKRTASYREEVKEIYDWEYGKTIEFSVKRRKRIKIRFELVDCRI